MKAHSPQLLAAALLFGALATVSGLPAKAPVAAVQSQDELFKSIQENIKAKKYPEVVTQAEQALKIEGLSGTDRNRFLTVAADASSRQSRFAQASAFYESIVIDPAISNANKIQALQKISDTYIDTLAGQFLDQMNLTPAHDALNRALKLPGLTPEEHATALKNIGALFKREDKFDQAVSTYQIIATLEVNDTTKTAAQKLIADAYAGGGQIDKAVAIYTEHEFDLVDLYKKLGETELAVSASTKVLNDDAATDNVRWSAFIALPYWDASHDLVARRSNIAGIRRMSEKYLPAFLQVDPNRGLQLLRVIKNDNYTPVFDTVYDNRGMANADFVSWAAPLLLQSPKISDSDYLFVKRKFINALMALGDVQQATVQLQNLSIDKRSDAAIRFWAELVVAGISGKSANVEKAINQENSLSKKEKAQEVLNAAQTALVNGNNQAARNLYSAYQGFFDQLPKATIECSFVPDAPFDVSAWLTSPLLKDPKSTAKLNRPYGDNLKFLLETDSSTTGRNTVDATGKSAGNSETNLHIACDAHGIQIFFDAHDTRAQEVFDGLLGGGSFEMYLAPGKDQAYYTFLPRLPQGTITTGANSFTTMYPNPGFRAPSTGDGTLRSLAHRTKNGFGLAMFLSWQLFYDKLPANGTEWQFESIRWTRSGGLSFAGSQSVHNRSSWGNIVFSGLTAENLNSIKRAIIHRAVTKYFDAKKITKPVGRWNDAELGDPTFYQSQVAPLLAHLDKYEAMVKADMTATDVETIFGEAVPGWMEIEFRVAALRRQYLSDKFMEGNLSVGNGFADGSLR